jgi:hypothetical protein
VQEEMRDTLVDLTRGMSTLAPTSPHEELTDIGNAANVTVMTAGEGSDGQAT